MVFLKNVYIWTFHKTNSYELPTPGTFLVKTSLTDGNHMIVCYIRNIDRIEEPLLYLIWDTLHLSCKIFYFQEIFAHDVLLG
jgi:hypothetical protein